MSAEARHYPVFIDLRGRLAVVVGGGAQAERRARAFVRHGADVAVIAEDPTEGLLELEAEGRLSIERRAYAAGDLAGAYIVVCVSGSDEVDEAAAREAEAQGSLVAVLGSRGLSNFVAPAVVRRGALQIAVSTGGTSPALAKRIRTRLAAEFGPEWAEYVELLGIVRAMVLDRVPPSERRDRMLEALAEDEAPLVALAAGERVDPEDVFKRLVMEHHD